MSPRTSDAQALGTGWAYPPVFSAGGKQVATVSGTEDVHEALRILFATQARERPLANSFGCNLDEFLFAPLSPALVERIEEHIARAVEAHEPRVRLLAVDVSPESDVAGVLRITLDYEVPLSGGRYNLAFPFALNEGGAQLG